MCNESCMNFCASNVKKEDVCGKDIIEVGSLYVNGSFRPIIENLNPASYMGVDIVKGPGVDKVCNAMDLIKEFGRESFDVVISSEMIEHVRNWQIVISNMKNLLKPNGILVITTRSAGFGYHAYPYDYWRYEISDAQVIFSDLVIESVEKDNSAPGILVKARKPENFLERDLSSYALYSILKNKRCIKINDLENAFYPAMARIKNFFSKMQGHSKII